MLCLEIPARPLDDGFDPRQHAVSWPTLASCHNDVSFPRIPNGSNTEYPTLLGTVLKAAVAFVSPQGLPTLPAN